MCAMSVIRTRTMRGKYIFGWLLFINEKQPPLIVYRFSAHDVMLRVGKFTVTWSRKRG